MPRKKLNLGTKKCLNCGKEILLKAKRDLKRRKFCSRKCRGAPQCNTPEANAKKSQKGESHPQWIKDRSKVKARRFFAEEKWFTQEALQDRDYICDITKEKGGNLSVHHLYNVAFQPELRYSKANIVVIKKSLHKLFHKIYGCGNYRPITAEMYIEFKNNIKKPYDSK